MVRRKGKCIKLSERGEKRRTVIEVEGKRNVRGGRRWDREG